MRGLFCLEKLDSTFKMCVFVCVVFKRIYFMREVYSARIKSLIPVLSCVCVCECVFF